MIEGICNTKNLPNLPLRVTKSDIDHLPPIERAFALHLIKTKPGKVFEIIDGETADDGRVD